MNQPAPSKAYLWFDLEFTTLDFERAAILEVAMVITDVHLARKAPPEQDLRMVVALEPGQAVSPWVRDNLPDLLDRCRGPGAVPAHEVESRVCAYVDEHLGAPSTRIEERPVIAGSSVHADYYLARRLLPGLLQRCHYRILDVTSFKLQWQDWIGAEPFDKEDRDLVARYFVEASLPPQAGTHDAYYDVQASIAELAFYRSQLRRSGEGT